MLLVISADCALILQQKRRGVVAIKSGRTPILIKLPPMIRDYADSEKTKLS